MEILVIIILLLVCVTLMAVEIFLIPGTSVAGISAGICLIIANILVFNDYGLVIGLWVLLASLVICIALAYWMMHSRSFDKYSLKESIDSTAASKEQLSVKAGDKGVTITRLALVGNAEIMGKTVEVRSADGFINEGTQIIVTKVEESQITVKKLPE